MWSPPAVSSCPQTFCSAHRSRSQRSHEPHLQTNKEEQWEKYHLHHHHQHHHHHHHHRKVIKTYKMLSSSVKISTLPRASPTESEQADKQQQKTKKKLKQDFIITIVFLFFCFFLGGRQLRDNSKICGVNALMPPPPPRHCHCSLLPLSNTLFISLPWINYFLHNERVSTGHLVLPRILSPASPRITSYFTTARCVSTEQ